MVGKVEPNDAKYLQMLLENGYTPVIASLAMDDDGKLYNVNADDAALAIARVLKAPLYYISDVPGVLDKNGNLIPELNESLVNTLIADGTISGGMTVKVKSALQATVQIQSTVYIAQNTTNTAQDSANQANQAVEKVEIVISKIPSDYEKLVAVENLAEIRGPEVLQQRA